MTYFILEYFNVVSNYFIKSTHLSFILIIHSAFCKVDMASKS